MRARVSVASALAALVLVSTTMVSATTVVTPGTAAQVTALVAASPSITSVDATVAAELPNAIFDSVYQLYPSIDVTNLGKCVTPTGCVFGDKTSKTVVVLYGDSHASMWLPALAPYATAHHWRLVLLYHPACPAVALPTAYSYTDATPNVYCTTFYADALSAVHTLRPALVLLSERTTQVFSEPAHVPFTTAQWRLALETTIDHLKGPATKVVVLEDLVWFETLPGLCLASNLTAVQNCAVPRPNHTDPGQQVAERQAAAATNSGYVRTSPWFCAATTCSPIVGEYITHIDQGHVSGTYARYLSQVLGAAVGRLLT